VTGVAGVAGERVISVVTAVHEPAARFLAESYASLRRQALPDADSNVSAAL
jgi:hypothetical protein